MNYGYTILGQPFQRLASDLAPGVPGDHVAVLPASLVLDRSVRRSCRHHTPGHSDAAAVSGVAFAEAGGPGGGAYPVG